MRIYNHSGTVVSAAPASLAVSVQNVIDYLKIDGTGETAFLELLIAASTEQAEAYMRRKVVTQILQSSYDFLPLQSYKTTGFRDEYSRRDYTDAFYLPFAPLQSITNIKTYSSDNVESVYSATNYYADIINARVVLNNDAVLPSGLRDHNSILITYVAGYTVIPSSIKLGILEQIKAMYDCRGACELCEPAIKAFAPFRLFDKEI